MPRYKSSSSSSIHSLSSAAARKVKSVAKKAVKGAVSAVKAIVQPKSRSSQQKDDATNWLEDIPIPDSITDADELQEYLSQPAERAKNIPALYGPTQASRP